MFKSTKKKSASIKPKTNVYKQIDEMTHTLIYKMTDAQLQEMADTLHIDTTGKKHAQIVFEVITETKKKTSVMVQVYRGLGHWYMKTVSSANLLSLSAKEFYAKAKEMVSSASSVIQKFFSFVLNLIPVLPVKEIMKEEREQMKKIEALFKQVLEKEIQKQSQCSPPIKPSKPAGGEGYTFDLDTSFNGMPAVVPYDNHAPAAAMCGGRRRRRTKRLRVKGSK